jgi:hypothetical protein
MTTNESPVIYASSVLAAQGVKLDTDTQAWLQARADHLRKILELPDTPMAVAIPVVDVRTGARIGSMTYTR